MKIASPLLGFLFLIVFGALASAQSFEPLGFLPGNLSSPSSFANGVSSDGTTVVGFGNSVNGWREAFRWTAETGMEGLGDLDGGYFVSHATAVSSDGSVIVGNGYDGNGPDYDSDIPNRAFAWTAADGMTALDVVDIYSSSEAHGVSGDGQTIVGQSVSTALVWRNGTVEELSNLSTVGISASDARSVSADGSHVVGWSYDGQFRAVRWDLTTPYANLTVIAGPRSQAHAISADGTTAVGSSSVSGASTLATAWSLGLGNSAADALDGVASAAGSSSASAVNAAGTVAVGSSYFGGSEFAFVWDQVNGVRDLKSVLETDFDLDLTGWELSRATGVSADGLTIVGNGRLNGVDQAWIARMTVETTAVLLGDCNLDGVVNFSDVPAFIAILILGDDLEEADINTDGEVNFRDIPPFVLILIGQ